MKIKTRTRKRQSPVSETVYITAVASLTVPGYTNGAGHSIKPHTYRCEVEGRASCHYLPGYGYRGHEVVAHEGMTLDDAVRALRKIVRAQAEIDLLEGALCCDNEDRVDALQDEIEALYEGCKYTA